VSPTGLADDDSLAIVAELDAAIAWARSAFERKDLTYLELFAPDLRYRRLDGLVVDREEVLTAAREMFRRIDRFHLSSVRESLELAEGSAEEIFQQTIVFAATAFLVLHRVSSVTRRLRYIWRKVEEIWRVAEVETLDETTDPGRIRLGFRPPSLEDNRGGGPGLSGP
jgi:hypothetical protein